MGVHVFPILNPLPPPSPYHKRSKAIEKLVKKKYKVQLKSQKLTKIEMIPINQ